MTGHIWISSDLQLSRAETARKVLRNAVDDMLSLDVTLDGVWCLGDALVGGNLSELEAVADACVELYERFEVPICYVMGNHEMDLRNRKEVNRHPLYERVRNRDGWSTMDTLSDPYFFRDILGHRVFFFGDHAAEDGSWFTSGGIVRGAVDQYPHQPHVYKRLRATIAASTKPVLIASHYAFRGGQRPSKLQEPLLPLPKNVRAHFHGHAHIGDLVWNKENPWIRANPIADSDLIQYNVSALETARTDGSHSALLTFEEDGSLRIRFRCHLAQEWIEEHVVHPVEGQGMPD